MGGSEVGGGLPPFNRVIWNFPFPRDGGAIYQKYQEGVGGQSLCWGALEEDDMPALVD